MKDPERSSFAAGPPAGRDPGTPRRDLLKSLLEIASSLAGQEDLAGVLGTITRELGLLIPIDQASIAVRENEGGDLSLRLTYDRGAEKLPAEGRRVPISEENPLGWAVLRRRPLWRNDVKADVRFKANPAGPEMRSEMVVPLLIGDRVLGTLNLASRSEQAFTAADFDILQRCGQLAAVAVEKSLLLRLTREHSLIDPLTEVYNQRHFRFLLGVEVERARRYARSMALLMIDVDDFKRINDTLGHPIGDQVLKGISKILKISVRSSDVLARFGGEEFAVILQEADATTARVVAEKFRSDIENQAMLEDGRSGRLRVTVSIGLALYPADAQEEADLVARADEALYRAKRSGKNRVCA